MGACFCTVAVGPDCEQAADVLYIVDPRTKEVRSIPRSALLPPSRTCGGPMDVTRRIAGDVTAVGDCAICLEPLAHTDVCKLPCNHLFHCHCMRRWIQQKPVATCPYCVRRVWEAPAVQVNTLVHQD